MAELEAGITAARSLGLDVTEPEGVLREVDERVGLVGEAAVVALVGGTGVGKSTLLNALAGAEVSAASVRRPTTDAPVAWVPAASREAFDPLLQWLGVDEVRVHEDGRTPAIGILDLPDLDSVEGAHRAQVEQLLAKVDAVVWVTDPEKYRDAVLHDEFFHRWIQRLDRQLVVLNKVDRLGDETETVRRHLERSLFPARRRGSLAQVVPVSAARGEVAPVRTWLREVVDAKRVVAGRLAASVQAELDDLAKRAGVDPDGGPPRLLDGGIRRAALDATSDEVLRLLDLESAERHAVAATRAAARPLGAGPLGRITGFFYRASGRQRQVADPARHLGAWAGRGSLAPAVDVLRRAVEAPVQEVPAEVRPALSQTADAAILSGRLRTAVDRAIASRTPMRPPRSRLWPVLGVLQTAATLTIAVAAAWLVILFLLRPPVDVVEIPGLGRVPIPFALLVAGIVVGFVVARLLGWHAGWVGRRWARELRAEVRAAVDRAVADEAFAAVDRVDAARRTIWRSVRAARESCGRFDRAA